MEQVGITKEQYDTVYSLLNGLVLFTFTHTAILPKGRMFLEQAKKADSPVFEERKRTSWFKFTTHPSWQFWGVVVGIV